MKILVPVDGSRFSKAAVEFIASRTTLLGADPTIRLLNVQAPVPGRAAQMVGKKVVREFHEDEAKKALGPARRALDKAGIAVQTDLRIGHAADEIAAAAADLDADLIVMGSHGHGALASAVLGSVTQAVLARTTHPLLVLRAKAAPKGDSLAVGIAVDGSKIGRTAARWAIKHRDLLGAAPRVTLIHVVPDFAGAVMPDMAGIALPAFSADDIRAMQAQAFEAAVKPVRELLAKAGIACEAVCLVGNAGDEIAAYARKRKLDLVLLGSHGYGAFKRAVLGSVATRVAAHCDTPLLLIRKA